jgi:hypothetical protein
VALSKLDLALVMLVAGGMLWVEHAHRISIGTAAAAAVAPPAASVCPDTDDVPFSADCIAFIDGGGSSADGLSVRAVGSAVAPSPAAQRLDGSRVPACPVSNENGPYSANCITFLSGWYWHPEDSAP